MPRTTIRPAYGRIKRLRRGVLKTAGLWPRHSYDVRLVYENDRIAYKQVVFPTREQARRIADTFRRYGPTPHLPALLGRHGRRVHVEFVPGESCRRTPDSLLPALAQCLGEFARRGARLVPVHTTPYPRELETHLADLYARNVVDRALHDALLARARALVPTHVRIGFDYTDPIGANLVQREQTHTICAIDIKNLYADTLVGQGLAKASARWLTSERQPIFFDLLNRQGLTDMPRTFDFLQLYERIARVGRKAARDFDTFGRLREHGKERAKLARLFE